MTFYMAFYMTSSKSFFDQCAFIRRVEGPQRVELSRSAAGIPTVGLALIERSM
jgi:hypothetical protein